MSRFHIDLQADILSDLKTRIVAPLLAADQFKSALARLSPRFSIEDHPYFAAIHMTTAIPLSEIGEGVLNVSDRADELTAAIDFAFQGF